MPPGVATLFLKHKCKTMKKSILSLIFIFAFVGLFGQIEGESYVKKRDCIEIEKAFITLIEMYKIECYNDSTLIDIYIDPNIKVTLDDRNIGYSNLLMGYYEKKWVHKEPTFADFINWLEK